MPQVKVIQPLSEQSKKLRVAAYARVSSDSADQLNSFATQVDYYTGYIQSKEEWEFAGLYADEAISGITADKRSDFQRLLADCHAGKIDRILVKSISRFARNTLDCIQTVRELKQLNIPVEFEKENIDTGSLGSEMLLSVLGAAAQEESLSISKNLKWNYRHRMKNGDFTTHIAPFGYSYKSKTLVPNPNEVPNLPIYSDIDGKQKIQYTITEIDTPDRYVQPASQTVTLTEGQATPVRFHNKLIRGSLQIIKVDHNGTTPLEGAEYQITDADGRAVAAKTTGKDGKILVENLRYGSYHYQEIEAPKGYDLDSTIYDFAIGYDEQVITVTRENTPSVGSISVCKVNSAGTPMSGVSFLLEFSVDDGASWKPVVARPAGSEVSIGGCDSSGLKDGVLVTGDDGIAAFTGLQIDNQTVKIRYRLTEIATRDGSTLMTTVLYDGSLPDVNGDTEITDVKITAVNNRNLELPNSGGSGFPVSSVGTVLIFIGLFFCVGSIRVLRKAR